jgi:hypothetical protein
MDGSPDKLVSVDLVGAGATISVLRTDEVPSGTAIGLLPRNPPARMKNKAVLTTVQDGLRSSDLKSAYRYLLGPRNAPWRS